VDTPQREEEATDPPIKVKSVAATILGEFFNALETENGLDEVAARLRKAVLEDGVFAEPSIRAALFPEES
jgi:hypothetical protein